MKRLLAIAIASLSLVGPALAADEEIQVYEDDMDKPGQFGLDLHNNYVFSGESTPDYPGEMSPVHRYRLTPEWSYGLTKEVELGLYLPLAEVDAAGHAEASGIKGRIKWIAAHPETQNWYWGLNLEVGRVSHALDINPWNAELKGIWGWRKGRWSVAMNANLDWTISRPDPATASLDIDTKIAYSLTKDFAVGVESYNGFGAFNNFGDFAGSDQALYGAVDASIGKWDLNFGVGHGYGASRDGWIAKAIISVPIDDR
jgi:hypothetical protein